MFLRGQRRQLQHSASHPDTNVVQPSTLAISWRTSLRSAYYPIKRMPLITRFYGIDAS